jgi:hypothetical protein
MKHGEKHDWEQHQHERLNVEEYQREEEVVTAVLEQKHRQEFLGELDAGKALVEAKSRSCRIGN